MNLSVLGVQREFLTVTPSSRQWSVKRLNDLTFLGANKIGLVRSMFFGSMITSWRICCLLFAANCLVFGLHAIEHHESCMCSWKSARYDVFHVDVPEVSFSYVLAV